MPQTIELNISSAEKIVINEPIGPLKKFIKLMLASVGLVFYAVGFHYAYFEVKQGVNIRVWEDLYGRGLFFFLTSAASYIYYSRNNTNISFFELEKSLRGLFALRMTAACLSYGLLALSFTRCF